MATGLIILFAVGGWPPDSIRPLNDHYRSLPQEQRVHTRYLTTFAVPEADKQRLDSVLSFWLNSLSSRPTIKRPQKVGDTGWAIDLRDYGWSPQSFAKVAKAEPYFRTDEKYPLGSTTLRADWFIHYTSDGSESTGYYDLLYDGTPPQTAEDFRKRWLVQLAEVQSYGLDTGAAVDTGSSIVALHARVLLRAPTILGAYHQSYDTANAVRDDDFIERLLDFDEAADAGEYITSLPNGLHAYLLTAGADDKRIDVADTEVARDTTTDGDVRVRTPRSCVTCHGPVKGLHTPGNAIAKLHAAGVPLTFPTGDYAAAEKISRFYLGNHDQLLERDKTAYSDAVAATAGDPPDVVASHYGAILEAYEGVLDLEAAARETGYTAEDIRTALEGKAIVSEKTAGIRLAGLAKGIPIPRVVWEDTGFWTLVLALRAASEKPVEKDAK